MIRVMETVLFCRSLHMCFNLTLFTACGEALSTLLACLRIDSKLNSPHFLKLNIFNKTFALYQIMYFPIHSRFH